MDLNVNIIVMPQDLERKAAELQRKEQELQRMQFGGNVIFSLTQILKKYCLHVVLFIWFAMMFSIVLQTVMSCVKVHSVHYK